jgi:ABC-2 type transport system ATP-binding protein
LDKQYAKLIDMQNAMAIETQQLSKTYLAREPGQGIMRGLIRPRMRAIGAVRDVSFCIHTGQRVAFVGPNGAGKSTALKMLTGILYPTSGDAQVLGMVPWKRRRQLSYQVGSIFGQRSQLWYHLPAEQTFTLLARMYEVEESAYRSRRAELVELFGLGALLGKPVRELSLGERMRCEIAASLLHQPRVLFLDEPTIGLDVTAKAVIRGLIRRISEQSGMTVLLTSHDTGDIEGVCDRVIVINQGTLILDSALDALRRRYIKHKVVTVQSEHERLEFNLDGVRRLETEPYKTRFEVDLGIAAIDTFIEKLLRTGAIHDLTVEDPPLEEIIKLIYAGGAAA